MLYPVDVLDMIQHKRFIDLLSAVKKKPLQAGKFGGILLALMLGIGGFFRIINARPIIDGPMLGDGQLLALIFIPLISLGLVVLVFVETLITAYRSVRADEAIRDQLTGRAGYILLRGAEAGIAIVGVTIMFTALPVLFAESTPAPAGVGIMLLLMAVGLGILVTSFVRSIVELFIYDGSV